MGACGKKSFCIKKKKRAEKKKNSSSSTYQRLIIFIFVFLPLLPPNLLSSLSPNDQRHMMDKGFFQKTKKRTNLKKEFKSKTWSFFKNYSCLILSYL